MRLIDLHCDTILRFMDSEMVLKKNDICVDIQKMQQAGSMAQFFALYVDLSENRDPMEYCMKMVDKFYSEIEANRLEIAVARNIKELDANEKQGKMSAFLTIEEGGALKGQMAYLRNFYRLGVRLITLTWNFPNEIGFPNYEFKHADQGLTPFGKEVVHEMNRLGMLIDVSHLSDQGFYDVADFSNKPFVASHSNARALCNHSRNLTDDMIRLLAHKGGVMGLNFERTFLTEKEDNNVEYMVAHLKHIRNVGGIDVLAIGGDLDGTINPSGISHIGEIGNLSDALVQAGFSQTEIEKIFYKNVRRVIKATL